MWLIVASGCLLCGLYCQAIQHITYDGYTKTRIVEAGEAGGVAGEDIPRAMNIEDLLDYDLFTITSEGLSYMNEGLGYYRDMGLYNVKLPSGERVAVHIN